MGKGRAYSAAAICAALAAIPVPAAAESRFVAGAATTAPQTVHLDFTIIIPAFLSLEMGRRARLGAAASVMEPGLSRRL